METEVNQTLDSTMVNIEALMGAVESEDESEPLIIDLTEAERERYGLEDVDLDCFPHPIDCLSLDTSHCMQSTLFKPLYILILFISELN